jgi:Legume lectin domain/Chitobiase/beta-hexosaminidase C-terminal domain/Fn3 associated
VRNLSPLGSAIRALVCLFAVFTVTSTMGQNVTTQHNDIARTGANTSETILTPANVNTASFGKLFYYVVDGYVYAQPLYIAGVTMGAGTSQPGTTHNVVFVATQHDSIYAFDAESNLGANGQPLWHITLLDAAHGAAPGATPELSSDFGYTDIVPEVGITSTPVIDTSTNTIYVTAKTKESGKYFYRLHALDITTGAEKFGGPVNIVGSVPGNGSGSSNGTLSFDPTFQLQRPALLLLNGIVYVAFGATFDVTTVWHGWIFGYNAATLTQTGVWCASPNGNGSSLWLGGAGLAADVVDPTGHPYGRLFTATGNDSFNATVPYDNTMSYAIAVLRLDLANGAPSMNTNGVQVGDMFAPFDQAKLDANDSDQGSGGTLILPDAVSGGKHLMVQVGKSGRIYILDRDNLGGFNPSNTTDPQQKGAVGGPLFGLPAYWNGHLYFWPAASSGPLKSFSFSNGVLSSSPTSHSAETSAFPGATPSVSSNGTSNGIVWTVRTDAFGSQGPAILYAHDATNVATLLYASTQNAPRDTPGPAVKFVTPTITKGKVYVGTENQLAVYGLLNGATQAAAPEISPVGQNFHPSIQITITDSTPNAQIFYTTDGTIPSTASTLYTAPFTISNTSTVKAVAVGSGLVASTVSSESYTLINQVPTPTFSPVPGDYTSAQSVTISTTWPNSTIYYTTDGSTPTTSSTVYTGPIPISSTTTLKAFATASGLTNSFLISGTYTIAANASNSINFSNGFTNTGISLVGRAVLSGSRLRLTDGGVTEAGAAWFNTQMNIQSFSTDFMFQQVPGTTPEADGLTFTIQRQGLTAIGPYGGLGYGDPKPTTPPTGIPTSVAVKFDLFSGAGEGPNSTGIYTNGASPTVPAVTLGGGVNLHTGDVFAVHITYDGATLTMTITDTTNSSQTFTTSWPINIPSTIGGNTAFVGFTGGTGHYTAVQDILNWTFVSTSGSGTPPPAATPLISPATGTYTSPQTVSITDATSGSSIFYTLDGSQPTSSSTPYTSPFTVSATTTVKAIATASGFSTSNTATSLITIQSGGAPTINFANGFTSTGLQFNGSATLNGTRLQLTDGGSREASSAWFTTPVNVQSFTNDFSFQFINANSDGMTFTIQNAGLSALGPNGGGLGYGATLPGNPLGIPTSVAVKFDLFQNVHEGTNSTGLYTNGASPTSPSVTIGNGVNLHSGDILQVHMTYDGTTLTMTITDTTTNAAFTTSWPIDIPTTVGGNTALVGFTGATGLSTITQIINWTYGP